MAASLNPNPSAARLGGLCVLNVVFSMVRFDKNSSGLNLIEPGKYVASAYFIWQDFRVFWKSAIQPRLLWAAFWKIITALKSNMTCYNLNLNAWKNYSWDCLTVPYCIRSLSNNFETCSYLCTYQFLRLVKNEFRFKL